MTIIGAQSEQEARRFTELGAAESSIRITGNIKYDLPIPNVDEEELRERLTAQGALVGPIPGDDEYQKGSQA